MTTERILSVRSSILDNNSDTKTFVEQSLSTGELVGENVPLFEEDPNITEEFSLESPSECPTSDKENVVEDEDSTSDKDTTVNMDTVNKKATTISDTSISENGPSCDKVTTGQIELTVERDTSEEKDPPSKDFTSGEPITAPYGKEMTPFNPFNIFSPMLPGFSPPQSPSNEDVKDDNVSLKEALEGLQPCQLRAIWAVREIAQGRYTAMLSPACFGYFFVILGRVESLGFTWIDAQRAAKYLAYSAPVLVHFQPQLLSSLQKDGVYRNRFETGSSMGNPKKNPRMLWEDIVFHEAYKSAKPEDRPKYGALNIVNDPRGIAHCWNQYGRAYLQLKREVRCRTTFADMDTSCRDVTVVDCDWQHILLLMQNFTNDELSEVLHVATNRKPYGDSNVMGWYKEVQIHGPICLEKDVEKIVVDRSYCKKKKKIVKFLFDKIKKMYKIPCETVGMD